MSYRNYYERSNYTRGRSTTTSFERPTSVTTRSYVTPTFKTSSIPILRDRSASREADPSIKSIANRYSTYSKTKLDENSKPKSTESSYNRLTVPNRVPSRDVSPSSSSQKFKLNTREASKSPDRRFNNASPVKDKREASPFEKEKSIPPKSEIKPMYNSNYSSFKLYSRPSSFSRTIAKPEITLSKYGINTNNSNYSLNNDFNTTKSKDTAKVEKIIEEDNRRAPITLQAKENDFPQDQIPDENEKEIISVVTRHTSPTPPGSSAYVRSRRAEMAKTIEKKITRLKRKPPMVDKEIQSDRLDDSTKACRLIATRAPSAAWVSYSPPTSRYSGYAGRYSTQYINVRESSTEHREHSKSRSPRSDFAKSKSPSKEKSPFKQFIEKEKTKDLVAVVCEENNNNNTSEIIINVNLKLKTAKQNNMFNSDQVSQEITITNNQLPPQVPKTDSTQTVKKVKARKNSSDSSSESRKKVVKKKLKSTSSEDSSDRDSSEKILESTNTSKTKVKKSSSSSSSLSSESSSKLSKTKSISKSKHSTASKSTGSRDNPNSDTRSFTNSMQTSSSEDDIGSKSKSNDISERSDSSRTSADITESLGKSLSKGNEPAKNDFNNTDEAKSFLIRALAPVTNLLKLKTQSSSDRDHWLEGSSESTSKDITNLPTESDDSKKIHRPADSISVSENNNKRKIRPIESGERAWWLQNEGENSSKEGSALSSNKGPDPRSPSASVFKIRTIESGERAWWLEANGEHKSDKTSSRDSEKYDFYKVRHVGSGDKDWWLSSESSIRDLSKNHVLSKSGSEPKAFPVSKLRHVDSDEKPWWLSSNQNIPEGVEVLPADAKDDSDSSSDCEVIQNCPIIPPFPLSLPEDEPLGDRRSPEGLETPQNDEYTADRRSPYEAYSTFAKATRREEVERAKFISRYADIDDILGTSSQICSPFMDSILARRGMTQYIDDDGIECEEIDPTQVRIHDSTAQLPVIKKLRCRSEIIDCINEDQLDDAALQIFKDGDYGPYLDLDSSLAEQEEEIDGLQDSRKSAIVMRTQLSVRVHAIIERLLKSQGRELRLALFSLKQILQSDKDLVHEFIASDGLDCLMQLGSMADQNYLDYILRALGQILLYVDGMHGVMEHSTCVRWLYSLIASKFRHVVKTSLKLLLVFVEYTEKNCSILIDAIHAEDSANGNQPWHIIMRILKDLDASDTELLIYAMTLMNRCLNSATDRNRYYDQIDCLEDQGINDIVQLYMSKQGTDLDLLRQFQIYEAVLAYEDGDDPSSALKQLDDSIVNSIRHRTELSGLSDRRRSKRSRIHDTKDEIQSSVNLDHYKIEDVITNGKCVPLPPVKEKENQAIRRRRERFARHAQLISQQQEYFFKKRDEEANVYNNMNQLNLCDTYNGNQVYTTGLKNRIQNGSLGHTVNVRDALIVLRQKNLENGVEKEESDDRYLVPRRNIKDIAKKLSAPNQTVNGSPEEKTTRVGDMSGLIMKAKQGLANSTSKEVIKSPTPVEIPKVEIKAENEVHWEELKNSLNRKLQLCDLDFTDLTKDDDEDLLGNASCNGIPPPPPPLPPVMCNYSSGGMTVPPPPAFGIPPPPPGTANSSLQHSWRSTNELNNNSSTEEPIKKNKKTVKLFWREVTETTIPEPLIKKVGGSIWDSLPEVAVDTASLEVLFESRSNDLLLKKLLEPKKTFILEAKRSNAINIAMKKLPTAQTIKSAILKMDATVIGREGIEKLITMLPTEEERSKIQEAQYANPDLPLGSAEQFLLALSSISELPSRLKLWLFRLDFENSEKEIADPLMDLKQGIEILTVNPTFRAILSTLRSVGSFLNGSNTKGFRLEYLSKVSEVKDTVQKHTLLFHICAIVMEKFPDSSDLFSELGPVIRAAKVDFEGLDSNLSKLEADCKASWDHLRRIVKHDGPMSGKFRMNEFLTDAAERIIMLQIIKMRVLNRYDKFLLFLGVPLQDVRKTRPTQFLKILHEFALEYRTTRERAMQKIEKRANHRERNKTRGKMIVDVESYQPNGDAMADKALKELLMADGGVAEDSNGSSYRKKPCHRDVLTRNDTSAEEEILQSFKSVSQSRSVVTSNKSRRERRKNSRKYENLSASQETRAFESHTA